MDKLKKWKKGRTIFVQSMGDLFGDWVDEETIRVVMKACAENKQHRYIFLTKSPHNLPLMSYIYTGVFSTHDDNMWFGTSVAVQQDFKQRLKGNHFINISGNTFLSVEPIQGEIDLTRINIGDVILNLLEGEAFTLLAKNKIKPVKWVIVGAMTGKEAKNYPVKREWVEKIVEDCRECNIPVFLKDNLAEVWKEALIQQFPW